MRIIAQKEILKNEINEVLSFKEAQDIHIDNKHIDILNVEKLNKSTHKNMQKSFSKIIKTGEKNLKNICEAVAKDLDINEVDRFEFFYTKDAIYILANKVAIVKSTGQAHDFIKYGEFKEYKGALKPHVLEYAFILEGVYKKLTQRYILDYKEINDDNNKINFQVDEGEIYPSEENRKKIYKDFLTYLNESYPVEDDLVGVMTNEENGKNILGVKEVASFDIKFPYLEEADEYIEILSIKDTKEILGKEGILQLYLRPWVNWWADKDYYLWHFTPQERVKSMIEVTSNINLVEEVSGEIYSYGTTHFELKRQKMDSYEMMRTLNFNKVLSSFIEPDENKQAVYQDVKGDYHSLNYFCKYDIKRILIDELVSEDKNEALMNFSNSFSTQNYIYRKKENERFLATIISENAHGSILFGDNGSVSFVIDEKEFEERNQIKILGFNADCY